MEVSKCPECQATPKLISHLFFNDAIGLPCKECGTLLAHTRLQFTLKMILGWMLLPLSITLAFLSEGLATLGWGLASLFILLVLSIIQLRFKFRVIGHTPKGGA